MSRELDLLVEEVVVRLRVLAARPPDEPKDVLEFVEPHPTGGDSVVQVTAEAAVKHQRKAGGFDYAVDDVALGDFIAVHYARYVRRKDDDEILTADWVQEHVPKKQASFQWLCWDTAPYTIALLVGNALLLHVFGKDPNWTRGRLRKLAGALGQPFKESP